MDPALQWRKRNLQQGSGSFEKSIMYIELSYKSDNDEVAWRKEEAELHLAENLWGQLVRRIYDMHCHLNKFVHF